MVSELDRVRDAENVEISENTAEDDVFDELLDEQQKLANKKEDREIVEHEKEALEEEAKDEPEKPKRKRRKKTKPKIKILKNLGEGKDKDSVSEKLGDGTVEEGTVEEDAHKKIAEEEFKEEVEASVEEITPRHEIKGEILEKASSFGKEKSISSGSIALHFLEDADKGNVFIGRKKIHFTKYGYEGTLHIGRVDEADQNGKNIYLDSLNPHVIFVCGARGSGKCLAGDSLIQLSNGKLVPIEELELVKENVLGLNHGLKIDSVGREGFFKRRVKRMLKLKFRTGKEIKLTPEHPLLTVNGWQPAEVIGVGGRIATPRKLGFFGEKEIKACELKLLAYLIAEGHTGKKFVIFSNYDGKIVSEFKQAVMEFDDNLRIETHSKKGCFRIVSRKKKVNTNNIVRDVRGRFTSEGFVIPQKSPLMNWLVELGLAGKLAKTKFIPDSMFQLKKEYLSLFLNRLFSCDGCIRKIGKKSKSWEVSYCSASKKLIQQVQHLLLRFGIISRFKEKKVRYRGKEFTSFELFIYGENVETFIKEIGFFGKKEEKEKIALAESASLDKNPNVDTIPREIWNEFKPKNWAETGRQLGYSSPKSLSHTKAYAPSRAKLLKLAQVEGNKGIELLAKSDIFWDEVIEVKELIGEFEVFDISIPNYHNFIANDLIVHNSYLMGVMAEELAKKNSNVGTIVIDPVGVFWSMKHPNKEEREIKELAKWGIEPEGLSNLKVFIPEGMKDKTPSNTYDSTFSIPPSLLTSEDWALTFGIERFSPTGLLLEVAIKKIQNGYVKVDGTKVKPKKTNFSLEDIIDCLDSDSMLHSKDRGYKPDSLRAVASRFEAAKAWGIFGARGTPLSELSREAQLTIIDTSFLDDAVAALVIGIIARRILAARKVTTRKEAAKQYKSKDVTQLLELDIPPTWLFIDEAHTLIPSGNVTTPATAALIEYVKQGRRPGCSLVFATQQPSAIDTKVLSQLDILLAHKLVFDDDIKAVYKRVPTVIPQKYKRSSFIKTLPVGTALTADRSELTSRAFIMKIRPRCSQHEGREAETHQRDLHISQKDAEKLVLQMVLGRLENEGKISVSSLQGTVDSLNTKYKSSVDMEKIKQLLSEQEGIILDENQILLESLEEEKVEEAIEPLEEEPKAKTPRLEVLGDEKTELLAMQLKISEKQAMQIANKNRKKRALGLFGKEEILQGISPKYITVWKISYDAFGAKQEFVQRECFIDSTTGEFLHFSREGFVNSHGLVAVGTLNPDASRLLRVMLSKKHDLKTMREKTGFSETKIRRLLEDLHSHNLVDCKKEKEKVHYTVKKEVELPPSENHEILQSLNNLPFTKVSAVARTQERVTKKEAIDSIKRLWPNIVVKRVSEVYRPVYDIQLLTPDGNKRKMQIDGVTGNLIS